MAELLGFHYPEVLFDAECMAEKAPAHVTASLELPAIDVVYFTHFWICRENACEHLWIV